jgi:hypothetical protein
MIGPDSYPPGESARASIVALQHGSLRALASYKSTKTITMRRRILLLAGRLRRLFNARTAAAIAVVHH